ncbi:MAG: SDR family NAD(P)-dependent oxidoreductase [Actinomycetota bacterium]|nr:SDR family NAD(P)-dependent oxidoreductase [Actinomycetota bacterium]
MSPPHARTPRFSDRYGPYALVAGGSDGLGAAFAEGIARRGVNLVLLARQADRLTATATRLRTGYNVEVIAIAADLANWDTVKKQLADLTVDIGLLVYDAAYAPIGHFEDVTAEQLAEAAAVNVRAPLLLTKLLSAPMIERGRGGIILMSSLAGGQGSPNLATYAATKSFTTILAEGLWRELKPRGVDVLACVAGAILTPGYQQAESAKPAPGTLTAEVVAETALKALASGKGPVVVPGAVNKLGRFVLTRLLTRRAAIALMSKNTGGLS